MEDFRLARARNSLIDLNRKNRLSLFGQIDINSMTGIDW